MHGIRPSHFSRKLMVVLALVFISCVVLGSGTRVLKAQASSPADQEQQRAVLYCLEGAFSSIAQRAEPGIVSITAIHRVSGSESSYDTDGASCDRPIPLRGADSRVQMGGGLDQLLSTEQAESPVKTSGSGTIVRRIGDFFYVLTNFHVVEDTYQVTVQLSDSTDVRGIVVGTDPVTDLAVVRISSPKLSERNIVMMGDSNKVKVGDWALAVGNPYGFEQTLTVGVVSALHRNLSEEDTDYPDLIQTDAAINKGNSGGPLLDVEGQVIGVNAAIASPTGGSIGLGFAIPVNVAKAVLNDLIQNGRVVRGWIGVGVQEMTSALQEFYSAKEGVLISSVDEKGPAAAAGLGSEDILTSFAGKKVDDVSQLQQLVSVTAPGSAVRVTALRQGTPRTFSLKVGISPLTPAGRPHPPVDSKDTGIKVRTLPSSLAKAIGMDGVSGVVVLGVPAGSPADEADLETGDVIMRLNGHEVSDEEDFSDKMKEVKPGGIVVLKVMRRGTTRILGYRSE